MKIILRLIPLFISIFLFNVNSIDGQIYIEKQTRHRFAQLTMGLDVHSTIGGNTKFINTEGGLEGLSLSASAYPRFIIGGTHFWGHADFYIAIPLLRPEFSVSNQKLHYVSGVESAFKYYPWKIQSNKIRPFVGLKLSPYYYYQDNENFENGRGARRHLVRTPLTGGFTYNKGNHLVELGVTYNQRNNIEYYIAPEVKVDIATPPIYASLSYKYMLETTISAEKNWENGKYSEAYDRLIKENKLDGLFFGVGLSSVWWLRSNEYAENSVPYTEGFGTNIMFDWTIGYLWAKPNIDISANYRGYKNASLTYGLYQEASRRSYSLELKKYFYDYHGFTPFVGPVLSYEQLKYDQVDGTNAPVNLSENKLAYGVTFGWDIRPTKMDAWLLRTTLRYFPNLNISDAEGNAFSFDNLEFNFIQFVMYPGRMF